MSKPSNSWVQTSLVIACMLVVMLIANNIGSSDQAVSNPESVACQATYYNQLVAQLASNPKAKLENNKFFFNATCQTQCILKGSKTITTLPTITTPDYVPCNVLQNKVTKQKQYCFQGQCLTLQQIAARLNPVTTTAAGGFRRRRPGAAQHDIHDMISSEDGGTWIFQPRNEDELEDDVDDDNSAIAE